MKKLLKIEWKRNFNYRLLIILILVSLMSVLLLQLGIAKYLSKTDNRENFVELEQSKSGQHPSYVIYFNNGFRILSQPNLIFSLYHNSTAFNDLIGFINSELSLRLGNSQMGKNIFDKSTGGVMDLSWYFLVVGSILVLAWGFGTFRNTEFIKFMMSFTHLRSIYLGIILARVLLIIFSLAILGIIIWTQFLLNGINLVPTDLINLLVFLLLTGIVMIIFLLIGSILGNMKNKARMAIIISLSWLVLLLVWPEILNSVFSKNAILNMKSKFDQEKQRMQILKDFEYTYASYSKMKSITEKENIDFLLSNFKGSNKKIEGIEYEMIGKTREIADRLHFWSIFNPVTFYKSVNNEISSMGYCGYIAFYEEVVKKQKAFVDFYIRKRFYEKSQKVEPFLAGDEYIFKSKSSLPRYFTAGLLLNLFYLLILLFIAYARLKRVIFPKIADREKFKFLEIKLFKGKYCVFFNRYEDFKNYWFKILTGKAAGLTGEISLDGQAILSGGKSEKQEFIYIPSPKFIPGEIQVKSILGLVNSKLKLQKANMDKIEAGFGDAVKRRFSELGKSEKLDMLLKLSGLTGIKIYLTSDILDVYDIPLKKIDQIVEDCKKDGILLLELRESPPYKKSLMNRFSIIVIEKGAYVEDDSFQD